MPIETRWDKAQLHDACPTCTCEPKKRSRTTVYAPNALLFGVCPMCGQPQWQSETWLFREGGWTPSTRDHCGCCKDGCPGHKQAT